MTEGRLAWIIVKRRRVLVQKVDTGIILPKSETVKVDDANPEGQARLLCASFFSGTTVPKDVQYVTYVESRSAKSRIHYFTVRRWTGSLLAKGVSLIWFPLAGWKRLPNEDDRKAMKEFVERIDLDTEK